MKCRGQGALAGPLTVVEKSYGMVVGGVDVEAVGGAVGTVVVCGPVVVTEGCVVVGTTVVELVVV